MAFGPLRLSKKNAPTADQICHAIPATTFLHSFQTVHSPNPRVRPLPRGQEAGQSPQPCPLHMPFSVR